ncbi:MAG: imidazole glycerol phosphate synthase subunit HisH [Phototrophicales bacterium]|nr:MAG: imidazole glycerol phosphate synthase subunit HisH [Phototrophicales bacterium]RMG72545.1 MAG: imidazole glycerol phosphate synthase subunit HisH [Chloroflexota bacterium]
MLAVIDYGAGNLRSVLHALKHLGAENIHIVRESSDFKDVHQIILPGVGAFGAGMQELKKRRLIDPIRDAIRRGVPYLGICLGMQFLFEYSDEMGHHEGLAVLPGFVTRFPENMGLKVPHMGWNQLIQDKESVLLQGLKPNSYAYFVHSYHCVPRNAGDLLASCDYGIRFAAGVERDNIYGVQFHPEKSQSVGLTILNNFLKIGARVS